MSDEPQFELFDTTPVPTTRSYLAPQPPNSPFAWYGGKAYYADWLIEQFPDHRVFIEPFGGAANVLIRKLESEVEIYNDLDGRLVNFFRVLRDRDQFAELVRQLQLTPYSRELFAEEVGRDAPADPVEQARWFFVRLRQSIGGVGMSKLYPSHWAMSLRTRREMAEPVSKYLSAIDGLSAIAERFRSVAIEQRPAVELIEKYDGDDVFFYCDPPYVPATRHGGRAGTYAAEMTFEDHERLLAALRAARGRVMLSGYPHPLYDETLVGWRREMLETKAHLNNSGEARTEVVWMNYRTDSLGSPRTESRL